MRIILLILLTIIFFSCSKDKTVLICDKTSLELHVDETDTIHLIHNSDLDYITNSNFVAFISPWRSQTPDIGIIRGMHVGETKIEITSGKSSIFIDVKVVPIYHTYIEPDLQWDESLNQIKEKYGIPSFETTDTIRYDNYSENAPILEFIFASSKLKKVSVFVIKEVESELKQFLEERYTYINDINDYDMTMANGFSQGSAKIIIGSKIYNSKYRIIDYIRN